jgi:hypothetical protein
VVIPNGEPVIASIKLVNYAGENWFRVMYRGKPGYVLGPLLSPQKGGTIDELPKLHC